MNRNWGRLGIAAFCLAAGTALAETPLEHGKYLVEGILTCGNCHTPRGPGGVLDTAKAYAGSPGPQIDTPEWSAHPTNITPDKETGIGSWTGKDLERTLRTGKRPNGQQLAPLMPYIFYKIMTPKDMQAVVAYIRSQAPVSNKVPPNVYKVKKLTISSPPPGAEKPLPESAMQDPVKRGFYLVTIGHCMECHTPLVKGKRDWNALGTGGEKFEGPWGTTVSRNITPHKEIGIGSWTDEEIKRAITQGVRKDGTKLRPPMGFQWYARMSPADLDAIVKYLRTIPAR
jgi:mono/diheme cytochrome c family protein